MHYLKTILFIVITGITQTGWAQAGKASAGEVTSLEWDILGDLIVTYAVGKSGKSLEVNCTAFNKNNKPVGGGFSYTRGGVARVRIEVPLKFKNTDEVSVSCTP